MLLLALSLISGTTTAEITIDGTKSSPISPYIYGANFPDWSKMPVDFPLSRLGGNRTTAYNWETNASNAGNDYHHQNDGLMGETDESGLAYRSFLRDAQFHGAAALLTIPTAGYVAADKKGDGDVNQTPDYIHTRFLVSKAKKGLPFVYPPDKTDKFVYQDEFVSWLEKIKSPRTPLWFSLDNEPDLWQSTHERIVPKNVGFAGIFANNVEFAEAIKEVAPKSLIFGPANYGWQGFRTFQEAPDRNGRDFLDFYLSGMKQMETKFGHRLVDVLDVHWYPEAQGDGVRITGGGADKPGTPSARIQAPRSLWDPAYVETSWIADSLGKKPITLLPMLKDKIAKQYPGTKLSITEYNYGGENIISGAIAQADVLGIFGRYGLFAACNWGISPKDTAQLAGLKAFLNYDGRSGMFGDKGLEVTGVNAETTSIYASLSSKLPGIMTIVAINKGDTSQSLKLSLKAFKVSKGVGYTFDSTHLKTSMKMDNLVVSKDSVTIIAPPESISTIELRK